MDRSFRLHRLRHRYRMYTAFRRCLPSFRLHPVSRKYNCPGHHKTVGAAAGITSCVSTCVSTGITIVSIVAIISIVAVISVVAVIISAVVIWIIIAVIIGYTILTKGVNNAVSIYPVSVAVL